MKAILIPGLLAAVVLVGAAAADQKPRLGGVWAFKTEPYHGGECILQGSMALRPGPTPDVFDCRLMAFEKCTGLEVRAEQSCEARLTSEGLTIKSAVVAVTPPDEDFSYLPDNFALPLLSSERMEGELRSAAVAPVVFIRPDPALS